MKLKILHVAEIDVVDGSTSSCTETCRFFFNEEGPAYCEAFDEGLKATATPGVYERVPRCLAAAGNHNILSKCLAGE